jgi:hypothetical protein
VGATGIEEKEEKKEDPRLSSGTATGIKIELRKSPDIAVNA